MNTRNENGHQQAIPPETQQEQSRSFRLRAEHPRVTRLSRKVDPRLLLVELVREQVGLMGTRIGCLTGDCGACTLMLDGEVVKSCLVLALSVDGRDVVTIEGAKGLNEIQEAFVSENGFQCGYCTTGMVLTARELLNSNPEATAADIRRAISGNLCRCTGYDDIVAAILRAAAAIRGNADPAVGHPSE